MAKAAKQKVKKYSAKAFLGPEPKFNAADVTDANRKSRLIGAFNWYNYFYASKDAKNFLQDYLHLQQDARFETFKKTSDTSVPKACGWLARMHKQGWELNEEELRMLNAAVDHAIESLVDSEVADVTDPVEAAPASNKPNIQDRMREKAAEAGGEIEGLLDQYIAEGCKTKHNLKPIDVLKAANILPAHVSDEIAHWEKVKGEFDAARSQSKKDADLHEGYSYLTKIQIRNVVKFLELVIADYHGYVAYKKAAKKPRKRKVKTPQQLVQKLKYMPEFAELNIKSVKPTDIVGAKEMFVYDTKKRKLMYFVVDEYAGTMTVRNNLIEGFDANKSSQKTLRNPKEQLKEFMAASKPNSRKLYTKTKAVDTKLSGRFNENVVILKVW